MTKAAALREYAGMLDAEPVAWLYTCQKPGTQTVYASVDENDSYHWPIDQWKSIAKTPLFAHPPAPTTQEPVAWLAAYVNSDGLPDKYVTTHHDLAVENDANGAPKPLFFNPPAPQRVPLTDEEILTAAGRLPGWLRHHEELDADDLIDFARAIEAAIRITK